MYMCEMAREIQTLNRKFQTIDSEYNAILQSKQLEIDALVTKLKEAKKQTKDDVLLNELQRLRENEHEMVRTVAFGLSRIWSMAFESSRSTIKWTS